jgi:hypothetical protein
VSIVAIDRRACLPLVRIQETRGASARSGVLPILGLSRKWAKAMTRGVCGSEMGGTGCGPGVEVFGGSRSNSDLQSISDNAEKRLENVNNSWKDFMELAALTPPSECRLPRCFLSSLRSCQ